jgi:molybdate transport system ATP-binding protein
MARSIGEDYVIMKDATFRGANGAVFANTNWRLAPDEHWAIRGSSGAGKSLFMAALTGRLPRLSGSLRHPFLEGRPHCADSVFGVLPPGSIAVASMDQHRAILAARAFHQLRWHGSLTTGAVLVNDYLSWTSVRNPNAYAVTEGDAAAVASFEATWDREVVRWELAPLLDRPLLALSNGELHRLLVARALLFEPRLLIVDDPYAGLDARTKAMLNENLSVVQSEGVGVLYVVARDEDVPASVTHEIEVARCAVARAGVRRSAAGPMASASEVSSIPQTVAPAPTGAEIVLEMRGIIVRQGSVTLLDGIDLTIHAGERWALVGPNGSGKSTLLSLILADNPQAYGNHIEVCGRQLGPGTPIWDIKRLLGWVSPELDAHYPLATPLLEVVLSGFRSSLGLYETLDAQSRDTAAIWLERVGLSASAPTALGDVNRLEQRLGFLARACVHRPKLLLLDEPCQGLDASDRARFAEVLELCLSELGAALIFVTHELAELPANIRRTLTLRAGRIDNRSICSESRPR